MTRTALTVARWTALTLGFALAAAHLQAQNATFTLPVQAHWGKMVLSPGEYTLQIPYAAGQKVVYVERDEKRMMATTLTMDANHPSERSYLHLTRVNGEFYVDAYQSAAVGQRLFFAAPKASHHTAELAQRDTMMIPVAGE
jgi:hypothetical protein